MRPKLTRLELLSEQSSLRLGFSEFRSNSFLSRLPQSSETHKHNLEIEISWNQIGAIRVMWQCCKLNFTRSSGELETLLVVFFDAKCVVHKEFVLS